jgi:hypothetical protein
MQASFKILTNDLGPPNPVTRIACRGDRPLGGFGANYYRSWVFPLYTPAGRTVLDAFPFDHPFHNGIFVGQHPVRVGGGDRQANFWVMPPQRQRQEAIFVNVGRMDASPVEPPAIAITDHGVRLTLPSVWRDEHEEPILDEQRTVAFSATDDATVCDVTSRKIAKYGPLKFPQTKYGAIGARIEPRLLPALGGAVIGDDWQRGSADRFAGRESDFVAYDNGQFGVCLIIREPDARGPWFVRDYGMAMYNPTHAKAIDVPPGGDWTIRLRVVAYDGSLTRERVGEWRSHEWQSS